MNVGLLLLIGLPGSGKSTLARRLQEETNEEGYYFIRISYDEFIPFVDLNGSEGQWKTLRQGMINIVQEVVTSLLDKKIETVPIVLKKQICNLTFQDNANYIVIIDDNMFYQSMRYSVYQVARDAGVAYAQVYLECPLDTALVVNKTRKEHLPASVIENMNKNLEPPNEQNKWERFSLKTNAHNDGNVFSHVLDLLRNCLSNTRYSIKESDDSSVESRLVCATNIYHQVDLLLREIVGNNIKSYHLQGHSKTDLKAHCEELSSKKSKCLNDLRSGLVTIPDDVLAGTNQASKNHHLKEFLVQTFFKH